MNANEIQIENGKTHIQTTKESYLNQCLICFAASLMAVNSGTVMGWSGPTLPKLLAIDSPILMYTNQQQWLVSLLEIGSICGTILTIFSIDLIGRKMSLIVAAFPAIICSILYTIATNIELLYIGRFLSGITVGISRSVVFIYVTEIASPKIRGALSTIVFTQLNIGLLLEYIIGSFLSYRINSSLLIIVPSLFILIFNFAPESPYYYVIKNDLKSARKSMETLRRTKNVDSELNEIQESIKKEQSEKQTWDLFVNKNNRKSLFLIFGLITCIKLCGNGILMHYVQLIFQQVENTHFSPEINSIIVVSSVFFSSPICTYLVDRWGRKPLFITSCCGVAVSLFFIGLYFFLKIQDFQYLHEISYMPVIFFLLYKISEGIGIGPIGHIAIVELFPTNVKAIAMATTRIYQSVVAFLVIQLYSIVVLHFHMYLIFWIFSCFAIILAIYVSFMFPETKNQSLAEIQKKINNIN